MANTPSAKEQLTLAEIEALLRIYYSPDEFPVAETAVAQLAAFGLVVPEGEWLRATKRGAAYCEMVRRVPLPVQVTEWRDPRE